MCWDAFNKLLGSASSVRLPSPFVFLAVPCRIEPAILFGMGLCIGVPGAEWKLNKMQAGWARALLGCPDARAGRWSCLFIECGWSHRLGTKMLERAIMLKARLALLPGNHPAFQLLSAAFASVAPTWATLILEAQASERFTTPVPDISTMLSASEVAEAQSCKVFRRSCLRMY